MMKELEFGSEKKTIVVIYIRQKYKIEHLKTKN